MINKFFINIIICTGLTFSSCEQTQSDRLILGEKYAREQLKIALFDTTVHNVINSYNLIIKDKTTAVDIVEPILFSIYGKDNIIAERPYETYLIDHYWIISGTLPKGYLGGTF